MVPDGAPHPTAHRTAHRTAAPHCSIGSSAPHPCHRLSAISGPLSVKRNRYACLSIAPDAPTPRPPSLLRPAYLARRLILPTALPPRRKRQVGPLRGLLQQAHHQRCHGLPALTDGVLLEHRQPGGFREIRVDRRPGLKPELPL